MAAPVTGAQELARWDGVGVRISEVVDHLARIRQPDDAPGPLPLSGVLNLIANVADPEAATQAEAMIRDLADHQPSRAVVLAARVGGRGIDARVSTSCRLARGVPSVCGELVTLILVDEARRGAASAVVPLLRSELPTFLLWWGRPECGDTVRAELWALADRVITDSRPDEDGPAALRALFALVRAGGPALTDLAWATVTPWRRLLAQVVGPDVVGRLTRGPAVASIGHAGERPPVAALLLGGWLRSGIGADLMIEFHGGQECPDGVASVDLRPTTGDNVAVERIGDRPAAAVHSERGRERRVMSLTLPGPASLLAGELELQRRDVVFESALACAMEAIG